MTLRPGEEIKILLNFVQQFCKIRLDPTLIGQTLIRTLSVPGTVEGSEPEGQGLDLTYVSIVILGVPSLRMAWGPLPFGLLLSGILTTPDLLAACR